MPAAIGVLPPGGLRPESDRDEAGDYLESSLQNFSSRSRPFSMLAMLVA